MDEFKRQGGHLGGREERSDAFRGEPKAVGGTLGGAGAQGTTSLTENENGTTGRHHGGENLGRTGNYGTNGSSGLSGTTDASGTTGKKPSLMDKLNPKKDTNNDGKAGIMS